MKTALLIAHPGHEIRIHHWLETVRPVVCVLTDGSGGGASSRIDSTRRVLERCGAGVGGVFARFTDKNLYEIILERRPKDLISVAEDLVKEWEALNIGSVAADMLEGFSPSHDVCRCLAGAAIEKLRRRTGRKVVNLDFPLEGLPDGSSPLKGSDVLDLDAAAFQRKRQAAMEYAELSTEVDRAIAAHGEAPFRREVLRPAPQPAGLYWDRKDRPFYETYGAKMVAAGRYRQVITFENHMKPVASALWEWASREP